MLNSELYQEPPTAAYACVDGRIAYLGELAAVVSYVTSYLHIVPRLIMD